MRNVTRLNAGKFRCQICHNNSPASSVSCLAFVSYNGMTIKPNLLITTTSHHKTSLPDALHASSSACLSWQILISLCWKSRRRGDCRRGPPVPHAPHRNYRYPESGSLPPLSNMMAQRLQWHLTHFDLVSHQWPDDVRVIQSAPLHRHLCSTDVITATTKDHTSAHQINL